MEITMTRVSLSLAVLIAIVCCADAMNYLAFPRMGRSELDKKELPWNFIVPRKRGFPKGFFVPRKRGYLAFPRMGRSGGKTDNEAGCCGLGLKDEFVVGQDGKEELRTLCSGSSECCDGLREIVDEKPDGIYYSMCIPDIPVAAHAGSRSPHVLSKLKNLLRK